MIELFTFRQMLVSIVILVCSCILILALESMLTPDHKKRQRNLHKEINNSLSTCWQTEEFEVKEECTPCTEFEKVSGNIPACAQSGFKELISCKTSGNYYRSCERVPWIEERNFWIFEGMMLAVGFVSAAMVVLRQKHLDRKMIERIQKQVSAGV
ncbi:protein JTB-like isoform X1 [Limulus polyphemus]|uniref:Protein JTB-like isoform X1 n=2 Tax=Limulus polyphemus TaxID=6850 RepID=A0ABM1B3N6_LIMPO|nr:protein JTB-like isoform X1 [Limulus polyphemus]